MKKSSTLTTTTSVPPSPTLSAQTLSASKISLNSSRCGSATGSQCGGSMSGGSMRSACQSPVRPGSGCVDAIKAKREEIEMETLLEKAKFYTSVCLGELIFYIPIHLKLIEVLLQVRLPFCRCSHSSS